MARASRKNERKIPSQAVKVKALYDFWTFLDMISFHGGSKSFGKIHHELADWTTRKAGKKRKLHLMPRSHLKSTLLSVGKTLWRIYQNENIRRYTGCSVTALSIAFVRELRAYLEDVWLQEHVWNNRPHIKGRLIPVMDRLSRSRRDSQDTEAQDKKIVWRNDAIQVLRADILKEPTVVSGSVGTLATGFHFDELVFDDIVTFDNADTPEKRDKLLNWVHDLESVLDPPWFDTELYDSLIAVGVPTKDAEHISWTGGIIDVLGTRYDKDDYYGMIIARQDELGFEVFSRNIYKNGNDATDGYIWNTRMNAQYERQLRNSMSVRRFASQYLNLCITPEEQILKSDRIKYYSPVCVKKVANGLVEVHLAERKEPALIRPTLCIDPAATTNKHSDYTAIGVGGLDKDQNLFILDLKFGKWTTDQWIKEMFELVDKWGLKSVTVEVNVFQIQILGTIKREFGKYHPIGLREYKAPIQLKKKEKIETMLQPFFENNMLYFPTYLANNTELIDIINYFPRQSVKDDPLDVMCMIVDNGKPVVLQVVPNTSRKFVNKKYGGFR